MSALPELPERVNFWPYVPRSGYTIEMVQAYGDARAAHARKQALEDTAAELEAMTCNNATARSAIKLCIETIKEMK